MADQSSRIDGNAIADYVARFRERRVHVHCITNSVAQHFTANVLLAAGATPSMTIARGEIDSFVEMADALLINLGTMDDERNRAVDIAVATANNLSKPWALDPVFVQASPDRLKLAKTLLEESPSLVRCNAGEGRALFGIEPNADSYVQKARLHKTVIALTGRSDMICNEKETTRVENGSPMMHQITAMGCALTALAVGFAAVDDNHPLAATSAIAFFGLAGEVAEKASNGPGTFVPHFLDALCNLSVAEIARGVEVS